MASSNFYTYTYLRKSDGTPYYVGKGKGRRVFRKHKGISVPKDRSRIVFLKENLIEEEAFKHERYMIAILGRKDLGTGILLNRTNGGEGVSGRIVTREERERLRKNGHILHEKGVGVHARSKKKMSEDGKKSGKISGNKHKENKTGVCGRSPEKMSEDGKKGGKIGGKITHEKGVGVHARSKKKMSEDGKKAGKIGGKIGGKTTSSQKWKCTVTGYTSNAGGLTYYQKSRGIDTSNRIKIDGLRSWEITFECDRVVVTTKSLKDWAEENGYKYDGVRDVKRGRTSKHRDIVKVVPL